MTIGLSQEQKDENMRSHFWVAGEDVVVCGDCDIGVWSGWRRHCSSSFDIPDSL